MLCKKCDDIGVIVVNETRKPFSNINFISTYQFAYSCTCDAGKIMDLPSIENNDIPKEFLQEEMDLNLN